MSAQVIGTQEPQVSREYRIAVSGPPAVGKSALTVRFTQALFVDEYDPTIEDSYKHYATVEGKNVLLDILDTAGQEDYASMKESYMRRGEGFLLVFSVTSLSSFESIQAFYDQIIRVKEDSDFVPIILIGNKSDLVEEREVSEQKALKLARDLKIPYVETSAKADQNVNEAFYSVVKMINRSAPIDVDHLTGQDKTAYAEAQNSSQNNYSADPNAAAVANSAAAPNSKDDGEVIGKRNKQSQATKPSSDSKSSGGGCCVVM